MLVVGAGGFAKENLEILLQNGIENNTVFYDDLNPINDRFLYGRFPILNSETEASEYFIKVDNRFVLGLGNPISRHLMCNKFELLGGKLTSIISQHSEIGSFDVLIGKGCNILSGVKISNSVKIGVGTIIYYNSIITHDVTIGDFVEISPNATLLGKVQIGNNSQIGAGAIILPGIKVGDNVVIGAGAVVTRDIYNNSKVKGIPAK